MVELIAANCKLDYANNIDFCYHHLNDLNLFFFDHHSNDVNNCRSGPGSNQECNRQNDFFPAFEGSGNICGGVEFSKTAIVSYFSIVQTYFVKSF